MDRVPNSVPARLKITAAGDHPDADLLTALAEQALPERERAQVLLHLSRCADCREILALATPPATTASPSLDTARRSWFQWPVLRWAAAAACVVIVGSAVLMKRGTMMSQLELRRTDSIVAMQTPKDEVSTQPPAPVSRESRQDLTAPNAPPAPAQRMIAEDAEEKRSVAEALGRSTKLKKEFSMTEVGGLAPPKATAAGAGIGGGMDAGIAGGVVGSKGRSTLAFEATPGNVPAPSANAWTAPSTLSAPQNEKNLSILNGNAGALPAPAAPAAPQAPPQKETIEVQGASSAVEVQAASSAVQTESVTEMREKREILGKAKAANAQLFDQMQAKDQARTNNEVVSDADSADKAKLAKNAMHGSFAAYSPLSRWTISSDGQLQHSIDAGKTWQPVAVAQNVAFRALSANGPDIWVGGAAGQLYHSPDSGGHWTQVKPEFGSAALSGDIAAIEFTDIRQGKVTTAKGEVWLTDDGGKTWRKQP